MCIPVHQYHINYHRHCKLRAWYIIHPVHRHVAWFNQNFTPLCAVCLECTQHGTSSSEKCISPLEGDMYLKKPTTLDEWCIIFSNNFLTSNHSWDRLHTDYISFGTWGSMTTHWRNKQQCNLKWRNTLLLDKKLMDVKH